MTFDGGNLLVNKPWSPILEELYRDHYDDLVACVRRMVRNAMLAEEVVQEAFLRFHTSGAAPAPGCELSYLRSIALNAGRGLLRRKKLADALVFDEVRPAPEAAEQCLSSESRMMLVEELENLPQRQREVVVLRYWVEMSEQETAGILNISPGSVKTHAWRGRAALRDGLSGRLAS